MIDFEEPIGVIGLGNMGGAVASNLARIGHEVVGFDLDARARERAANDGVAIVGSMVEAMDRAEVLITSLPNESVVRSVWLDEDGVASKARSGAFVLELSTIARQTMLDVANRGRRNGLRVIDCPVSGSPAAAREGRLALIVGASREDYEEIRPLLDAMGNSVAHVGDVGMAKVVKLVNNLMAMGNVLVAAEAFQVGVAAGVDPQRLYEVLSTSGGRSHHFVSRFPRALEGDFAPGFSIGLGEKDLALGIDLARSVGVPAPAASTVRSLFSVAMAEGLGSDDIVGLLRMYQKWSEQ